MTQVKDEEQIHQDLVNVIWRMKKVRLNAMSSHVVYTEYQALYQINLYMMEHPDSPGIYVSKLALDLLITPPAASRLLNTMEGKGLIARTVDKGSRRNTFVSLTPAGSEILTQTAKDLEESKLRLIRRMGYEDITKLIELWNKLAEVMEEEVESTRSRHKEELEEHT